MADRDKKVEGELRVRLVPVTEDPAFQGGRHKDNNKRIIGGMIDVAAEEQHESEGGRTGTIH